MIWCLPQNLVGYIMYKIFKDCPHENLNDRIITYWGKGKNGCSMGRYLFIPDNTNFPPMQEKTTQNFIVHEYGHTIQSLISGPFWFLIFGFESMLWCLLWEHTKLNSISYCSFYPEKNANYFGEKVFGHKGIYW